MKKIDFISTQLILISAILFIALYFVLSFYNRPVSDDVYFISKLKNQSVFDLLSYTYANWSGRWTSGLYFLTVISMSANFEHIHFFTFLYYCVTLIVLSYSLNTILYISIQKAFGINLEKILVGSFSILFIATFYYFTISHMETFWWICASFIYLQGIVFLLFGTALLIQKNKTLLHYIFISICFIYVGASYELYTIIVFCLFIIAFVLFWKEKAAIKMMLLGFIPFCLSGIICFIAPGNYNRKIQWVAENMGVSNSIHLDNFLQYKYVIAFGFALLWTILGTQLSNRTKLTIEAKKIVFIGSIPFLVSLIITVGFQFFILNNIAIPFRAWTFTGFAFSIFICVSMFILGYCKPFKSLYLKGIVCIALPICILLIQTISLYKQFNYASNYANAYDTLIQALQTNKLDLKKEEIIVHDLPESGMLIRLEIKSDYMKNSLTDIFELQKKIVVQ